MANFEELINEAMNLASQEDLQQAEKICAKLLKEQPFNTEFGHCQAPYGASHPLSQ